MVIKTKLFIGLGIVLISLIGLRFALSAQQPTDQVLIDQAIKDAITAAKQGRSGPVLDFVSSQFKVNATEAFSRFDVAKFVRENHPDVVIENTTATVTGDTAVIVSPVKATLELLPGQKIEHTFKDVKLEFRKESSTRWLVIPSKQWRLYKVDSEAVSQVPAFGL